MYDDKQERQARFLAQLREGWTITRAAEKAGINPSTLYSWREADDAFAAEWDGARRAGLDRFVDHVTDLAEPELVVELDRNGDVIPMRDLNTGEVLYARDPITDEVLLGPDGEPLVRPQLKKRVPSDTALKLKGAAMAEFAARRQVDVNGQVSVEHNLNGGDSVARVRRVIDAGSLSLAEIQVLMPMLHRRLPEGPDKQHLGWSLGIGAERALPRPEEVLDVDFVEVTED